MLADSICNPTSFAAIASGLFCLALGGLLLFGALRCTLLSLARVWRSPGYPGCHWRIVWQCFRRILRTELILLAAVSGATVLAICSEGWLADRADLAVGVAGAIFVYYQLVMVACVNEMLRHASVIPYFPRRVGDINAYSSGESLWRHVDEFDELARTHAVTPLSAFGWNDDLEGEPVVWHASAEGLKTVNFLLVALEGDEMGWDDHAATIADLKQIAHALERADAQGIPFSLLLRHSTFASSQEWDARQGTCALKIANGCFTERLRFVHVHVIIRRNGWLPPPRPCRNSLGETSPMKKATSMIRHLVSRTGTIPDRARRRTRRRLRPALELLERKALLAPFVVGGDPIVDAADFRVTAFASGLNFPTGVLAEPDGSLLVVVNNPPAGGTNFYNTTAQILRLIDTTGDGVADGQPTVLASGLPGADSAIAQAGPYVITTGSAGTISFLHTGATPTSPLTLSGSDQPRLPVSVESHDLRAGGTPRTRPSGRF